MKIWSLKNSFTFKCAKVFNSNNRMMRVWVNCQKEFTYTSNCKMDLRVSRTNNHKNSGFTWKPNLGKLRGEEKEFTIFRELQQWILQRSILFFCLDISSQNISVKRCMSKDLPLLVPSQYLIYPGISLDGTSHAGFNNSTIYTWSFVMV